MATRRIYYDDAFEREFSAQVLSCEPTVHSTVQAWDVVLDRTAFYPTSGGQPNDVGKLGEAHVLDVRDEEDQIVHVVDKELASGPVNGCIDWGRRFDHMQQHTGQHLLSAMFLERYGRPTVSFHLGVELSTIDLRGPEPSEEILEGAERAANQIIFEDRPVTVRYGTAEDLARLGARKEVERSGILRAIEIEGADLQPCGGTHVKKTGQIGTLLVRRCVKMRQDWRVEFVCGARAERAARRDFLLLRQAAEKLGCATEDLVASVDRAVAERDSNFKTGRALLERLAEAEAALALKTARPGRNGQRVIVRTFGEESQAEYLGQFAGQVAKSEKTICLLARLPSGELIFAQHPSAARDMSALLKRVLGEVGGKGGGTRDFARGRLADASQVESALASAREKLSGS
jgi:alanyl-tRNA synthetase